MTPNYILMFLSTRKIVYKPQLGHFLKVVEVVMFFYYEREFLHKFLPGYVFLVCVSQMKYSEYYFFDIYGTVQYMYITVSTYRFG